MIIIEGVLIAYSIYFVGYALFFSVTGLLYRLPKLDQNLKQYKKFAILIPGYKEDAVIVDAIKKNLEVNYPKEFFDIVSIADSFEEETLTELEKLPIVVEKVSFEKSTKVKSLSHVIQRLPDQYDYVIVLDADNVMEKEYLLKVNSFLFATDSKAVQSQRWPKNVNSELAVLDGISESINNHIYRQGAHASGMSVSLSGSGMIFERNIFQNKITKMESIGGFDRELEFKLLEDGIKVVYFREALVYDQKTDNHNNFTNQRTRWISSQYVYLMKYLGKGISQLLRGNVVYFHSTVWRNIQLPRLINLGLISIFTLLAVVFRTYLSLSYLIWVVLFSLFVFSLLISIPRKLYNKHLVLSIFMLPKLFLSMLLIMFKLKGANKKFIHTEHKSV